MSAKDKDELVLNPITGQLDMIRKFNPDRIITHQFNDTGGPLTVTDQQNNILNLGPLPVVDNNGNLVFT